MTETNLAMLPEFMELVGGPYCGALYWVRDQSISDVFSLLTKIPPYEASLPAECQIDPHTQDALFTGPLGGCVYRYNGGRSWLFHSYYAADQ